MPNQVPTLASIMIAMDFKNSSSSSLSRDSASARASSGVQATEPPLDSTAGSGYQISEAHTVTAENGSTMTNTAHNKQKTKAT